MTVAVENKSTISELLKSGIMEHLQDTAIQVHVRLMFLRVGK